jgi:predicted secreted protein
VKVIIFELVDREAALDQEARFQTAKSHKLAQTRFSDIVIKIWSIFQNQAFQKLSLSFVIADTFTGGALSTNAFAVKFQARLLELSV